MWRSRNFVPAVKVKPVLQATVPTYHLSKKEAILVYTSRIINSKSMLELSDMFPNAEIQDESSSFFSDLDSATSTNMVSPL